MWRPWTKSQLQHHRKGWETEASYRIAGISAIFLLLLMAISQGLQRTGTSERYRLALQLTSGWLLLYYFRLLWRIIVGSQLAHQIPERRLLPLLGLLLASIGGRLIMS